LLSRAHRESFLANPFRDEEYLGALVQILDVGMEVGIKVSSSSATPSFRCVIDIDLNALIWTSGLFTSSERHRRLGVPFVFEATPPLLSRFLRMLEMSNEVLS
jgi:hypothetical protein